MQPCRWMLAAAVFFGMDAAVNCGESSGPRGSEIAVTREGNVVEEFDVARNGELIMIPVTIGGQPFKFGIGTGWDKTMLDETLPIDLEPAGRPKTPLKGTNPNRLFHVPDAFVGESRLPITGDAQLFDLSGLRKIEALPISGFLGMNFLKAFVVQIDFDAGKLSLLRSVPESSGTEFKLTRHPRGIPMLEVEAGDRIVPCFIDAGSSFLETCSFGKETFADLLEGGHVYNVGPPRPAVSAKGPMTFRRATLDRLRVGNFEVQDVVVAEAQGCTLGLTYLARYVVTFDFLHDRLYLKEGAQFGVPARCELSGMWIRRLDSGDKIVSMTRTGPAPDAGVQVGDRVLKVDGKDSSEFSQFELRRIFTERGRKVQVVMERDAEQFEVELVLPTKPELFPRGFSRQIEE